MKTAHPKSYMTDAERAELRAGGMSENGMYLAESQAANAANDAEASWAWLAKAELPAYTLMSLKKWNGAQFIRDMGFPTANADAAYGPGWLDQA
jgi:hypothetical protein